METTRVKDIEFRSAEHVLQEIENMNVRGGSPFGRSAAWAYKLAIEQEDLPTYEALYARVCDLEKKLHDYKPTMATIYNSSKIIRSFVERNNAWSITKLKEKTVKLCENIIEKSFEAVEKLSVYGANLISDGGTVMMHSYSSTLMGIYKQATLDGKKFTVICTESRPLRESRNAVKILQECGQKVIFISDASAWEFMPKADLIIMGADTLCTNGDVANKMGSAQIAQLALACKKPVYFASELYKLDTRTLYGRPVELERRTQWELVSEDDFPSFDNLEVINQFFDITPARNITGIITEYGVLNPAQMLPYWDTLVKSLEE
ncbi:MAG: translation initiation factor eIF-2B [Solobacterium sp.]|nr:translation initiation factor eIF-2B [Solobacterium sp.]